MASINGFLEIVKYLIEMGANVNSIWGSWLEYKMTAYTLINNFNDPFHQKYEKYEKFEYRKFAVFLIENGML